jgi:hypothetical protein
MKGSTDFLFSQGDLSPTLDNQDRKLRDEVETKPETYVLNVNEEEFVKYLVSEFRIEPLELSPDELHITAQGELDDEIEDYGRLIRVKRPFIDFALPFRGDPNLFKLRPNQFTLNPPRAKVSGQVLSWSTSPTNDAPPERLKSGIDSFIASIQQYCSWQRPLIDSWNNALEEKIRSLFRTRKDRLLKNANFVSALGIPMKKRSDPEGSYVVPVSPKRLHCQPPAPTTKFEPHPALTETDYQEILRHLRHMSHTIERMPDAFQLLGEEQIRTQFLMHLNGTYEGSATGETFSHQGKTDIFLKSRERAIFIAECKFWTGGADFPGIIDQLLGYLTWRETKTAILLFVRNQDVAQVAEQIPKLVGSHKNFTRHDGQPHGLGECRFVMKSARDESLPIIMTVMVFHLPKAVPRTRRSEK